MIAKWLSPGTNSAHFQEEGTGFATNQDGVLQKAADFDLTVFQSLAQELGDEDACELLVEFLANSKEMLENMRAHFAAQEFATMGALAHSLKSSAAMLGLMRLSEAAQQLEELAMKDDAGRIGASSLEIYCAYNDASPLIEDQVKNRTLGVSGASEEAPIQFDRRKMVAEP